MQLSNRFPNCLAKVDSPQQSSLPKLKQEIPGSPGRTMKKLLILAAVALQGCGLLAKTGVGHPPEPTVSLTASVDPAYAPVPSDAVVVESPDQQTPEDRSLRVLLAAEMARSRFNLVDDRRSAKWILSAATRSGSYRMIGNTMEPVPAAQTDGASNTAIFVSLFAVNKVAAGKSDPAWKAVLVAKEADYLQYPYALLHALLGRYGENVAAQNVKVDSAYQDKAAGQASP